MHSKIYVCMMIYLIGPMGSGKTTIGKILSSRLKYQFFDTDEEIKKKIGMSISSILINKVRVGLGLLNHKCLRNCHKAKIYNFNRRRNCSYEENRVIMKNGTCIYLKIDFEEQLKGLANSDDRPLVSKNSDGSIEKTNAAKSPSFLI